MPPTVLHGDPIWLATALRELNVSETPGPKSNARIDEYALATRGGVPPSGDETAWCSSHANWVLLQHQIIGTRTKRARDWLSWGVGCGFVLGCIVVLSRGSNPDFGHVAFGVYADQRDCWLLGGNQGDKVSVARYPRARILGTRWPVGWPLPAAA